MSKLPPEDMYSADGDLPPPYTAEASNIPSYGASTTSSSIHPDSLFAVHLASMRCQIRDQQATRASIQDEHDTRLLSQLVPHVEAILASIAAMDPAPRLVQTTLVPDSAVSPDWKASEAEQERKGELCRVIRVEAQRPAKAAGDVKRPPQQPETASSNEQEFDGWGRWGDDATGGGSGGDDASRAERELWWSDEDMARRLARHLQPKNKTVAVERQTVAAKAVEAKKSKSRWNILGNRGSEAPAPAPAPSKQAVQVEDEVSMSVAAEEVTFRRENEMGIWESNTGWGVVVRVKIRS